MQRPARLVLALSLSLCLAACGDDDDDDDDVVLPDAATPDGPIATIGPVSDLQAAADDATGIDVSWTNPTDATLAGVLVVRGDADVTFEPVDGMTYTVGTNVGIGEIVVFGASGTSFHDAAPVPGLSHTYRAWAYDTNNLYSSSVATQGLNNRLPSEPATLEVAIATPGVAVTQEPPHFGLSGTAAYDSGTQTLTVSLAVENQTGRVVFNGKTVIDSVDEGTVGGPTLGGLPYAYYGPAALAIGVPVTRDIVITGVTGATDPITVDLHIVDAPMVFTGNGFDVYESAASLVDLGVNAVGGGAACDGNAYTDHNANANGACSWRPGALSADATSLFVGHRSLPVIRRIDTTTMGTAAMTNLESAAALGSVDSVTWGPNGKLFAVLNIGGHAYADDTPRNDTSDSYLVRIDPTTLAEEARVQLHTSATDGSIRGRTVAFSSDGALAAVPLLNLGQVQLVDVATMTVVDTDSETAGDQPIDVSASSARVKAVAFSPDGSALYVGYRSNTAVDHLDVVDLTTYEITALTATSGTLEVGGMAFDATGRLWVARIGTPDTGVAVFDVSATPANETDIAISNGGTEGTHAVAFSPDGTTAYVATQSSEVAVIDTATLTRTDTDGDGGNGVTNLPLANIMGQHLLIVTPF